MSRVMESSRRAVNSEFGLRIISTVVRSRITAIGSAGHFGLPRLPTASPAAQVFDRYPVDKRGVEQANRGVDEVVDLEEACDDNGVGLTGGQRPVHEPGGNAHRPRPSPRHPREGK